MPKVMLVTQVRTSPVLAPNAVLPPPPPKALESPPPRPFWIRISRIMKMLTKTKRTRKVQKKKPAMVAPNLTSPQRRVQFTAETQRSQREEGRMENRGWRMEQVFSQF